MSTQGSPSKDLRGPIAFLAGGVLGSTIFALGSLGTDRLEGEDLRGYADVRGLVEDEFVEARSRDRLLTAAIEGLVADLDPYSRFYSGEDLRRVERSTSGSYLGLGAVFLYPTEAGIVLFPMVGSPAEQAGLVVGDRVLAIDGELLADMPAGEFERRLRTLTEVPIELLVERGPGEPRALVVQPADVVDPTVRHGELLQGEIGYLAVTSFSRHTLEEFDTEMARLTDAGMGSLVLDLRGNLGGVLDAATAIANRFIPEGTLLITETRSGPRVTSALADEATYAATPVVVLVDEDSASASEVLAGALQDHRIAVLVGTSTYGKGTVQTMVPTQTPEGIVKVTTGFYTTPSGRSIDRHYRAAIEGAETAITPDVLVHLSDEGRLDVRRFLTSYSPPPALAEAVGKLQDGLNRQRTMHPETDLQLAAALALLTGDAL